MSPLIQALFWVGGVVILPTTLAAIEVGGKLAFLDGVMVLEFLEPIGGIFSPPK
jgi:hypothetical protein